MMFMMQMYLSTNMGCYRDPLCLHGPTAIESRQSAAAPAGGKGDPIACACKLGRNVCVSKFA
jgi:hypothetical protein